jgi:hypothetical protein
MDRSNSLDVVPPVLNSKGKKNKEMLKDKTEVASILCSRSSIYTRVKHLLIIPNLIISSVSAIVNNQNIEHNTLKIYNTIINSITVLLLGLTTTLKVSENADAFKNSANALTKLLHEIEGKEASDTITVDFISTSTQQYDLIMGTLPNFPTHIKNEVRGEFGGKKWLPLCINGIVKIVVEPASPSRSFVGNSELP